MKKLLVYLALSLVLLAGVVCLAQAAMITGPPPALPPSPVPPSTWPDLRGTWTGSATTADPTGANKVKALNLKITERGINNVYRGWLTAGTDPAQICVIKFLGNGTMTLGVPNAAATLTLKFKDVPVSTIFPGGFQPELEGQVMGTNIGSGTMMDTPFGGYVLLLKSTP
jgi:hypothetical protein